MSNELPPADLPAWRHTKAHRRAVQAALKNRRQTGHVLRELKAERARQDARWGQQDHPDMSSGAHQDVLRSAADQQRRLADFHAQRGTLAWDHILMEEVREARAEAAGGNQAHLRAELIQVMAVAAAWVEALDRRSGRVHEDAIVPVFEVPETVQVMDTTFHGPDDVCTEGQTHTTKCVQIPGLEPPHYVLATADLARWQAEDQEREELDVSSDFNQAGRAGMRTTVAGMARAKMSPKRLVQGLGIDDRTKEALANLGYTVEEFPEGSALYDSVVIRPERGKAQAYVSERGGLTAAEFDAKHPRGAAGQPVTSYSGGGVRDVTEGKPRFDLMYPLGVPFEAQMLTRVAHWLELGMRKYAERNWEKFHTQESLDHALGSKARHDVHYACGDTDEDHAAAIITNVIFAETIRWKIANGWTPDQEPRLR